MARMSAQAGLSTKGPLLDFHQFRKVTKKGEAQTNDVAEANATGKGDLGLLRMAISEDSLIRTCSTDGKKKSK